MAIAQHPIRHGVELRRHHQGNPGFEDQSRQGAAKLRRGDADDGQLLAIHADSGADHAGVGAETPLPEAVADDGNRIAALLIAVLLGREESAGSGFYSQHGKIVSRYEFAPDPLGMVFVADAQGIGFGDGEAGEQFQMVAVILVVGIGASHELAVGRLALKGQELAAVGDARDGAQQYGVDPTENGGAGRYADRQGEHGDQGEARVLERHTEAEA